MRAGQLTASGDSAFIFSKPQLFERAGLVAPLVSRVIDRLRMLGWPLPADIYTEKDLLSILKSLAGASA
jgi:hypothetical protein